MNQRHRRINPGQGQQHGERPAGQHSTTDNRDVFTCNRDMIVTKKRQNTRWRAGKDFGRARTKGTKIERVQTIDILLMINGRKNTRLINV
ncbi:hypothetical protein D3C80_1792660 [compost metagenome]